MQPCTEYLRCVRKNYTQEFFKNFGNTGNFIFFQVKTSTGTGIQMP